MVKIHRQVWNRRQVLFQKKRGMLVLDAFKGHLEERVKGNDTSVHSHSDHSEGMSYQLQDINVAIDRQFSDCLLCGDGCYLGTAQ